ASERTGYIDGVQINLKEIWTALPVNKGKAGIRNGRNPSAPGACAANDDQPGNGAGRPQKASGYPGSGTEPTGGSNAAAGPRWGWMTGWGTNITLGAYSPTTDSGLYYIPKGSTTNSADIVANLTESGYTSSERTVLLSGSGESTTTYRNRVKILLGLAGWKSGKTNGKYSSGGDGDNVIDTNEITQTVSYPFDSGSWDSYIDYVISSSTEMEATD